MKRIIDGVMIGTGIVAVLAVAIVIAWAGDVFTVDKDGVPKFAVSDAGKITVGATESYVNLVVQNDDVATESDNKLDITADVLTVEGVRLENVALSANIEATGAGGLDSGSEAANTWYYVFVIANNDGTSWNGLLSTSSTSPTMPSGFTKKRRVGAVKNSLGNFLLFVQEGNKCIYSDWSTTQRVVSSGVEIGWTIVDVSPVVPSTSRLCIISNQFEATYGSSGYKGSFIRTAGATSTYGPNLLWTYFVGGTPHATTRIAEVPTDNSNRVEYRLSAAPSSGGIQIDIFGYYDRI
ncbi:MAG: hypothetical protein A2Z34_11550 [Planctomycetes bacterium RBG_16_59_8]|nr:MAG: hypothetical protein A2Z34_11550 [Planctomycetes bacterium RBG_16_59_8]